MFSKRQRYRHLALSYLLLCALLTCLTGCSVGGSGPTSASTATANGGASSPTTKQATPTVATQPVPATQTDCPAQNQGRALVTAPLAQGTQPHILYLHNDGTFDIPEPNSSSHDTHTKRSIRSYDPVTQTSKIIATSLDKQEIYSGTLSQDGQWLLLMTADYSKSWNPTTMAQAIRVDGQGLQTLLCLDDGISFKASPDLHKIAFSHRIQYPGSPNTVHILDTTTGNLTTEVDIPKREQEYTFHDPFPSIWISNTQFLLKDLESQPDNAYTYLVDTAKGEHQTLASLPIIYKQPYSSATLLDEQLLLTSITCQNDSRCNSNNFQSSSLSLFSLQNNTVRDVYQSTQLAMDNAAYIAPSQGYLFLARNITTSTIEIWSIKSDGSQPQKLVSVALDPQLLQNGEFMNRFLRISPDHNQYIVNNWPTGNNAEMRIYYGSVQGGPLQAIPDSTNATAIDWVLL